MGVGDRSIIILLILIGLFMPCYSESAAVGKDLPEKKITTSINPIHGSLPYRNLNYFSKEPLLSPAIIPAYRGGTQGITPEDTKDTPEAPSSLEITTLAESLNWNTVAIYEYVKNNIETEWYFGCMKGAEETLRQGSGNDCDQATLLVALLRASGFPSRYVRGTIEFFPDISKAKNLIGIDDPLKIAEFFQKAGIPYKPVIQGGKIANFQIEHIWVESFIPYGNYRGTMIDQSDPIWLGLDTSIKVKGYTYNSPLELPAESIQLSGIKDEYLGAVQTLEPVEYIKAKIRETTQKEPEEYQVTRSLMPDYMKILPNTLQFEQRHITHEYVGIPEELRHKVKLRAVSDQLSANTSPLFDITLDTMSLSNRKIALTYEPETVEDQEIMDSYGGLDNTPAYLVKLRPALKVDEERVAVGRDGLPMGSNYTLTIELISPNGTEKIEKSQIAGSLTAIAIVAQRAISSQLSAISEEDDAETILFKEANRYIGRWSSSEDELSSLLHLKITRPIPTVAISGNVMDVSYLDGVPQSMSWKGVFMDASLRAIDVTPSRSPLTQGGDQGRKKIFMELSALQGSVLEHKIFEEDLQVESISTVKLVQISNQLSVISNQSSGNSNQLLTIDKTNIDSVLPTLSIDDNIREDITNTVNQGLIVRLPFANSLPLTAISYLDWTGIGYIKENQTTGEAGYMLSGMIAGGMTAVSPKKWSSLYLAEVLGKPYGRDYRLVMITRPLHASVVTMPVITVSGIVMDADIQVSVNGGRARISGTTFEAAGVTLRRGLNTITATATNSRGKSMSQSIQVKYRVPLKAFITFPFDGLDLSGDAVDVEGVVSDILASVTVSGVPAMILPDGRFIAKGVAIAAGMNQITATAVNTDNDTDTFTITVNGKGAQAQEMAITITSPQEGGTITRPEVTVTGTVASDADEISLKVNGVLADLHNGQFIAHNVPLTEGNNVIVVNAIDTNGAKGRAEVTVTMVKSPYVTLSANITSGIPPLTAYFSVSTATPNPVALYQIDLDGDGVIDFTGPDFDNISLTYTTEGVYFPKVTVTDAMGNIYTDIIAITVLNKAKIDALLRGKWENMKTALTAGEIEGALSQFINENMDTYREMLNQFGFNKIVAILSRNNGFKLSMFYGRSAECSALKTEDDGAVYSYPVHFVIDVNGLWKIRGF